MEGWSVRALGEGGCVHMEGVECAWTRRRRMCAYGSVHAWEREDVCIYGRFECACMGGCVHMEGVEWRAWGEGDVYLEGVECVCMGRGRVCIWKGGVCVHAWEEGGCVYRRGQMACMGRGRCVFGRGGVCVHGSLFPGPTQLSVAYSTVKLGGAWERGYVHGEREGVCI